MNTKLQTNLQYSVLWLVVMIAGCSVGPKYQRPKMDVPEQWHQQLTADFTDANAVSAMWWQVLNEPVLDDLIQQAQENNPTLESAYYSLLQARYMRDYTAGRYDPSVDAIGSYTRTRSSDNGLGASSHNPYNMHTIGFDAAWELDLFGRIRRSVESAQAMYEAGFENYRDTLVTLSAEVASTYVELRTTQARLHFALKNVESQQGMLELAQTRFDAELVPKLDVSQAVLNISNTQSEIPTLRSIETSAIHRLSVLVGQEPGHLHELLSETSAIPQLSDKIHIQMPAELLRMRPDIRRTERQLAAQVANEGVATADLYPSFTLTGVIGFGAANLSDLTDSSSRNYSFGPSLRWNIFNGNRIRNQIKIEEAKSEQLFAQYRHTVLMALEEVENAMSDYVYEHQRMERLTESVQAAKESVQLATDQYRNGLTNFQNVLDMQRTQVQQEDKLAGSQGQVIQNFVRIQKALGGGWQLMDDEQTTPASDKQD